MSTNTVGNFDRKRKSVKKTLHAQGITIPFSPHLAALIGVNDSLLLIQINYWLNNLRSNVEVIEGVKWLNLSAEGMRERGFEHLSRQNINRTIERLERRGLLRVDYLPGSRTKWLTLNYEKIEALGVKFNSAEVTEDWNDSFQGNGTKGSKDGTKGSNSGVNHSKNGTKRSKAPYILIRSEDQIQPDQGDDHAATIEPADSPPSFQHVQNDQNLILDNDPPDDELEDMMISIAAATKMDPQLSWHKRQIKPVASELLDAGYTPADVDHHGEWWRNNDWRGKKGDVPRLRELADTLRQSLPEGDQKKSYGPAKKESARLRQIADPTCDHCDGYGWTTTWDPRNPVWNRCACTERINQKTVTQAISVST